MDLISPETKEPSTALPSLFCCRESQLFGNLVPAFLLLFNLTKALVLMTLISEEKKIISH